MSDDSTVPVAGGADRPVDLVSFDLDGTLVDTGGEIAEAVNRALADVGMASCSRAQIEKLIGAGAHALMRRLLAQIDPECHLDHALLMARLDHHYALTAGTCSELYPGASTCLQSLRDGGVRLALVTNKEFRHARRVLDAHRLGEVFDLVIGGDSLAWKKPDARVLRYVATTLQVGLDRIVHVGDSVTDLEAARQAGVRDWAVPWGYNGGRSVVEDCPGRLFESLPAVARHVLASRAVHPVACASALGSAEGDR